MPKVSFPIIVTRAQPGADETSRWMAAQGYAPIVSPCLTLRRDLAVELPEAETYHDIAFTSANGVRFYAEARGDRDQTAWCVGPATADAARQARFMRVEESAGDSVALANFILGRRAYSDKPILHIANAAAKGDFARALAAPDVTVDFCPLYRAERAASLLPEAIFALESTKPTLVMVHSAKGAEAFVHLTASCDALNLYGVAISGRAAQPLRALDLLGLTIAQDPNEKGMQDALRNAVDSL